MATVHVSTRLVTRVIEWALSRDPHTGRRPVLTAAPFLLVSCGVGAYSAATTGRLTGSAVFLGLAGGTLFLSARFLYDAARSLFREPPSLEQAVATGRRRKELEREKALLLKALKELEFDHKMRKVSDEDFAEIGGVYRTRAIRVMRQLDEKQADYAALVEEELAKARRGKKPEGRAQVETPSTCAACTTLNDADAVFCKKCATRLVAA